MQENKNFIVVCCLFWTFFLVIALLANDINILFGIILVPVLILGWFALFLVAIFRLFSQSYLPWEKRLVPLSFSIIPVFVLLLIGEIKKELREEATWLTITNADFHGSNNFQFMKNGEYSSWRDSPLGRSAEESGHYERQDSILILHPDPKDGKVHEFKLAIRPYSEFKRQQSSQHIILVTLDTSVRDY